MGEHIALAADLARTREHLEKGRGRRRLAIGTRPTSDYEVHVQIPHVADMLAKDFGLPVAM